MRGGLGRRQATDVRDQNYLASPPPTEPERQWRYWYHHGWWGNQGLKPHCVAYAWMHYLADSPITHPSKNPLYTPALFYSTCQELDEWEGSDYDGTSVRAGAKALKSAGVISDYLWIFDAQTAADWILTRGTLVCGTEWYTRCSYPEKIGANHFIKPMGTMEGGHAWELYGYNAKTRVFAMKNSWGRKWADSGVARIRFEDLQLLLQNDGECCAAIEANGGDGA